jgi:hypothetical protein
MKSQCEELESLAGQVEKQAATETEPEPLIELEEEMEYKKGNVASLAQALKETIPAEFKERAQQAIRDSAKIAEEGKRWLGDLRARLEFRSADSEAGSYKGPVGPVAEAGPENRHPMGAPERGRRMGEGSFPAAADLATLLRGFGQLRANDSGWPTFDGRYASYLQFKREWEAYRETYYSVVNIDLAAKTLREKCVKGDALKMVSHLDDLGEMWDNFDTCYERPEKYMEEALRPILEFRKYKVFESGAVRKFYSILRAAIKGARSIGRLDLLVNDTVPRIMGKMPYTDWREWATKRPEWVREDLGAPFERFVEQKWQDALNVAAAEPLPWEQEGPKREKVTSSKAAVEKAPQGHKGVAKTVGSANVVTQQPVWGTQQPTWGRRRCRVQEQTGCGGDHLVLQCGKLRGLSLNERRRALEASGLCMFRLRHPANTECFDQGGRTACVQPGCKGRHAVRVHELLGGVNASVNLVAEEGHGMEEDENLYVSIARIGQEEGGWQEPDDSWLKLEGGESEEEAGVY